MAEFTRCKFCRISFSNFRNHIYSEKHKKKIISILKKFKTKIKQAKMLLKCPEVESAYWEKDCKFWCHFCEAESQKHVHLDMATVKYGGFLRHISETSHIEKVEQFWCHQRIRDQKTETYTISQEKLDEFEKRASVTLQEFIARKEEDFAEKLADLKKIECMRRQQISSGPHTVPVVPETVTPKTVHHTLGQNTGGYRTVAAKGEGLTCISINTDATSFHGNVYTGATPPWLMEESKPSVADKTIGPTRADYDKHLEAEKKRKLPSTRVGANVQETGGVDWMPSFGRVWSKQSRQQQRKWPFNGLGGKTASNPQSRTHYKTTVKQRNKESTSGLDVNPDKRVGDYTEQWQVNVRMEEGQESNGTEERRMERDLSSRLGHSGADDTARFYTNSHGKTSTSSVMQEETELLNDHKAMSSENRSFHVVRPYVKKKHSNNMGLGKIEISQNLL